MSRALLRLAMLLAPLASAPAPVGAEQLADGLQRCSHEADERQRLACFDALVSASAGIQRDHFGMTADIARKRDPAAASNADDEKLSGSITALRESRGQLIFTLDNGQVWIQAEPQANLRFTVGEAVNIEHGTMSSLWLTASHHRKTRVKRVQ